ncbi:MAG: COR domain-containing protein [Pseudomonadota bacterium]
MMKASLSKTIPTPPVEIVKQGRQAIIDYYAASPNSTAGILANAKKTNCTSYEHYAPKLADNGKLHRNDLKSLLNNQTYPKRKHDYLLELMKKFELCYALNNNEYLLPDLFPIQEPEF